LIISLSDYQERIVDDNKDIRRAVRHLFETHDNFEVCGEAVNGKDAIAKTEQLNPDLIVLDLSMPVMNGMEAARAIRERKPATPIILFTLHGDLALQSAASAIGIRAVVAKTELENLVTQVSDVLRSSSPGKVPKLEN
jgi:DNA-binding NarL/FixJ family response regulator